MTGRHAVHGAPGAATPGASERIHPSGHDLVPAGFDADAARRLAEMDGHFWTRGRVRLVERLLARIPAGRTRAVELGCGTGTMLGLLEERFAEVVGVDAYRALLDLAEIRSRTARLVQADVTGTGLPDGCADLVVALDVLEHVDPAALLAEARRIAAPDGMLLVAVPASPVLWSAMDVAAGHRCRYTRGRLARELRDGGWRPAGHTHFQCLLYPLVWVGAFLGTRAAGGVERRPPAVLARALEAVNRFEVTTFGGTALPFGSSLFMWARRDPEPPR